MFKNKIAKVLTVFALVASNAFAQHVEVLYDFNKTKSPFNIQKTVKLGNKFLVIGGNSTTGIELWELNQDETGTTLIKDINPGESSSISTYQFKIHRINNKLYFMANDGLENAIWVTDGTSAGTFKAIGTSPDLHDISHLAAVNQKLVFIALDKNERQKVFISDGTPSGTSSVFQAPVARPDSKYELSRITPFYDRLEDVPLFFVKTWDGTIIATDGTSQNIKTLPLQIGSNTSFNLHGLLSNKAFVSTTNYTDDDTEWRQYFYDYTTNNLSSAAEMHIEDSSVFNNKLYLLSGGGITVSGLTAATTAKIQVIPDQPECSSSFAIQKMLVAGNSIYFGGSCETTSGELYILFKSNGTLAGTTRIDSFNGKSSLSGFTLHQGAADELYYSYQKYDYNSDDDDSVFRNYLYRAGTSPGRLVHASDVYPGQNFIEHVSLVNKKLFVQVSSYINSAHTTYEFDRISGVTKLNEVGASTSNLGSSPEIVSNLNGNLLVSATDSSNIRKSYFFNLITKEPSVVNLPEINHVFTRADERYMTKQGNRLLFSYLRDDSRNLRLFSLDGGGNNTILLKDLSPTRKYAVRFFKENNAQYFTYHDYDDNAYVYRINDEGTGVIKVNDPKTLAFFQTDQNIFLQNISSYPGYKCRVSVSNVSGGTTVIKEIPFPEYFYECKGLKYINDKLYFYVGSEQPGWDYAEGQLWVSDGTTSGTVKYNAFGNDVYAFEVAGTLNGEDIVAACDSNADCSIYKFNWLSGAPALLSPNFLTVKDRFDITEYVHQLGNKLVFIAYDNNGEHRIFRTDGTPEGTIALSPIRRFLDGSYPYNFQIHNGVLYFITWGDLWRVDGTPEGTFKYELELAVNGDYNANYAVFGNVVLFSGNFPASSIRTGAELQFYNNDTGEHGVYADIFPGANSSTPASFYVKDNVLYMSAFSPHIGKELFAVTISDQCPQDDSKFSPGICGCGIPDIDTDNDGVPDCADSCSNDKSKISDGICGCGVSDSDANGNGIIDCMEASEVNLTGVKLAKPKFKVNKKKLNITMQSFDNVTYVFQYTLTNPAKPLKKGKKPKVITVTSDTNVISIKLPKTGITLQGSYCITSRAIAANKSLASPKAKFKAKAAK